MWLSSQAFVHGLIRHKGAQLLNIKTCFLSIVFKYQNVWSFCVFALSTSPKHQNSTAEHSPILILWMRKDKYFARTCYRHHILRFSYTHAIFDQAFIDPTVIDANGPPKNKAFSHHCRPIWQCSTSPVNKESKMSPYDAEMNPGIKKYRNQWVTIAVSHFIKNKIKQRHQAFHFRLFLFSCQKNKRTRYISTLN